MSLLLTLVLLLGLVPMAFAADSQAQDAAEALYQLGLFQGTGKNADGSPKFDLNRAPTRAEAVTMLVRLLGKETEAKSSEWDIPFTDVADCRTGRKIFPQTAAVCGSFLQLHKSLIFPLIALAILLLFCYLRK